MNAQVFEFTLRRRLRPTALAALGLFAVIVLVCALFPAVGDSFGKVDLGKGATELLGGGDFSTLEGWLNVEIFSIYGPAVVIAVAITGIVGVSAAEEENGVLGLLIALPLERGAVLLSKWVAISASVVALGACVWLELLLGVAIAGGGIGAGALAAQITQMTLLGVAFGALAFAIAAATGRRGLAIGASAALALLSYLLNGLAPAVAGLSWMQKLSPFYYYNGNDPLANGIDLAHLIVLATLAATLTGVGVVGVRRRDLRG